VPRSFAMRRRQLPLWSRGHPTEQLVGAHRLQRSERQNQHHGNTAPPVAQQNALRMPRDSHSGSKARDSKILCRFHRQQSHSNRSLGREEAQQLKHVVQRAHGEIIPDERLVNAWGGVCACVRACVFVSVSESVSEHTQESRRHSLEMP
jgi:hypothetical protein